MPVFHNIGSVIKSVRVTLEAAVDETGRDLRLLWTPEINFLQFLCLLVPDDLLFAPNLNRPPALALTMACSDTQTKDFLLQRSADITAMTKRVSMWYERHLPLETEENKSSIASLVKLRKTFEYLERINQATLAELQNKNKDKDGKSTVNDGECCSPRTCALYAASDCSIVCAACCHCCCDCVVDNEQRHFENVGIADAVSGSSYGGGITGVFTGEMGGYYMAKSDEYCYECCSDVCGPKWAYLCCCDHSMNQGTAGVITGEGHSSRHVAAGAGSLSANCTEMFRDCYCGAFKWSGAACSSSFDFCKDGIFTILDFVAVIRAFAFKFVVDVFGGGVEALSNCRLRSCWKCVFGEIRNIWSALVECAGFIRSCCFRSGDDAVSCSECGSACGRACGGGCDVGECCHCECNSCDDCGKVCTSIVVTVTGTLSYIWSFVGDEETSETSSDISSNVTAAPLYGITESRRQLGNQSSPSYYPSIIFMTIALFLMLPRVLSNILYPLLNMYQGISRDRSKKILIAQCLIGFPLAVIACYFGGASRWTYVTFELAFTSAMYVIFNRNYKYATSNNRDTSFLSCEEWRKVPEHLFEAKVNELIGHKVLFEVGKNDLAASCSWTCLRIADVLWAPALKLIVRWNISEHILLTHAPTVQAAEAIDVESDVVLDYTNGKLSGASSSNVGIEIPSAPSPVDSVPPMETRILPQSEKILPHGFYPLTRLRTPGPYPDDVDATKRDSYLTDSEFVGLFNMTRAQFNLLPQWKKNNLKGKFGLF